MENEMDTLANQLHNAMHASLAPDGSIYKNVQLIVEEAMAKAAIVAYGRINCIEAEWMYRHRITPFHILNELGLKDREQVNACIKAGQFLKDNPSD